MKRRAREMFILVVVAIMALPLCSWGQFSFTTNNGAITINYYTGAGGNVVIPSTTNGHPVTTIANSAFISKSTITGITIPNSITNIGGNAFAFCSHLKNVVVPDSVINLGGAAFQSCYGLTNAVIGDGVNAIFSYTFQSCTNLASVTLGQGITYIGAYAFDACSALRNVIIPNNVTIIDVNGFGSCYNLTNVTFGSNVISLGTRAFVACSALTNGLNLPTSLQSLGIDTFAGCSGLTSVIIPKGLTNFDSVPFVGCSSVTNIAVDAANPNFASPGGVLYNKNLSKLIVYPEGLAGSNYVIPDSVTVIGEAAFYHCPALTSMTIPRSVMDFGSYVFELCPNLHQVYFQGNAPTVNGVDGSLDNSIFYGESGTVYYLPGASGWSTNYGGWPTVQWYQPQPQILNSGLGPGAQSNEFQFTISWATNTAVVVEASTNLLNWTPVITNALVNGTNAFSDSGYTNYPQRFYRARSQ